jgi:hypothetical protein
MREITKEPLFCCPAEASLDEIRDFGDDELRHEQGTGVGFKELQACFVVAVVPVDVSVEGPESTISVIDAPAVE